jgi:hypothetical protein
MNVLINNDITDLFRCINLKLITTHGKFVLMAKGVGT